MNLYFVNKTICNDYYNNICNNYGMEKYSDRLKFALDIRGMSQSDLARKLGTTPQTIQYLCRKGTKSVHSVKIAQILRINPIWLTEGVGPMEIDNKSMPKTLPAPDPIESNAVKGPEIKGKLPLISWVQAGDWCEAIDNYSTGDAEDWFRCPSAHGKNAYALRVVGDSMTSPFPGQRTYPEGTIIFVDPDKVIHNGCRVIAKLPNTEEVTFKEYREDSGKRYLKPINPQYDKQEITEDTRLCGVIIGSYYPE